jgi:hypothetical protein
MSDTTDESGDLEGQHELEHVLTSELELNLDGFSIDAMEDPDAIRDAIRTVEQDHDAAQWVVGKMPYYTLRVRWNENTESVRVDVFKMAATFQASETERTALTQFEEKSA